MRNIIIVFVLSLLVGKYFGSNGEDIKSKKKLSNPFTESPYDRMDYRDNMANFTYVHWVQVDNVKKACDEVSSKPFLHPVLACANFSSYFFFNVCSIYSHKNLQMWTLGHEMRHCFQGHFHT